MGSAAVRLQLPHTYRIHPVFHVSLIKPYRQSEHTATPPPPLQADDAGIPIYEVEDVLAHKPYRKGRRNSWQFLIKWKGYGHEHNSWEPLDNIDNKDITLDPYWKSIGGEPQKTNIRQSDKQKKKQTQTKQKDKRRRTHNS